MSAVSTLVKTIIAIHLDYCRSLLSVTQLSSLHSLPPAHTISFLLKVILHQVTSWHSYSQNTALSFLLHQNKWPGGTTQPGPRSHSNLSPSLFSLLQAHWLLAVPVALQPHSLLRVFAFGLPSAWKVPVPDFQTQASLFPPGVFSIVTFSRDLFLTILFKIVTLATQKLTINCPFLHGNLLKYLKI